MGTQNEIIESIMNGKINAEQLAIVEMLSTQERPDLDEEAAMFCVDLWLGNTLSDIEALLLYGHILKRNPFY